MDLSTTPRRATEGVGDLQKTRVAKSVFSIRSLVDVEEAELPAQDDERSPSESLVRFSAFWHFNRSADRSIDRSPLNASKRSVISGGIARKRRTRRVLSPDDPRSFGDVPIVSCISGKTYSAGIVPDKYLAFS